MAAWICISSLSFGIIHVNEFMNGNNSKTKRKSPRQFFRKFYILYNCAEISPKN